MRRHPIYALFGAIVLALFAYAAVRSYDLPSLFDSTASRTAGGAVFFHK